MYLLYKTMEHIILLHGAIGASDQVRALADKLSANYKVHTPDLAGHGGRAIPNEPFSIQLFAANVLDYMKTNGLDKASIFGYSMGGYVGMYLASRHRERINKVVTLATKFHWDELVSAKEVQTLDPDKMEQKIPAFADMLKNRHTPEQWRYVLMKTREMMVNLGNDNTLKPDHFKAIEIPTLIMLGDRDRMVTLDETLNVFRSLPKAQMAMLPNTPHPMEQVDADMIAYFVHKFIG